MTIKLNDKKLNLPDSEIEVKFAKGNTHTIEITQENKVQILITPLEAIKLAACLNEMASVYFKGIENELSDFIFGMNEYQGNG